MFLMAIPARKQRQSPAQTSLFLWTSFYFVAHTSPWLVSTGAALCSGELVSGYHTSCPYLLWLTGQSSSLLFHQRLPLLLLLFHQWLPLLLLLSRLPKACCPALTGRSGRLWFLAYCTLSILGSALGPK